MIPLFARFYGCRNVHARYEDYKYSDKPARIFFSRALALKKRKHPLFGLWKDRRWISIKGYPNPIPNPCNFLEDSSTTRTKTGILSEENCEQ